MSRRLAARSLRTNWQNNAPEQAGTQAMTHIAFFGHDAGDAAIRRRVAAFRADGMDVTGYMMRRRTDIVPEWDNVDLGLTRDGDFVQRVRAVLAGAKLAAGDERLDRADLIYARNLDMLACAFMARARRKLKTPMVYESLDVHRLLTRGDLVGKVMRALERRMLKACRGLVVSSPAFLSQHFDRHYSGLFKAHLVENRIPEAGKLQARPNLNEIRPASDQKLRLGWVGNLRCQRSFSLLLALADRFPDRLEVHLHGQPARREIPDFEPLIDSRPNVFYHGRYCAPEDLAKVYRDIDLVWAGDFMEAGFNSVWLLPNRIYEGGYFVTPAIAPAGTQTGAWIERNQAGLTVREPLEHTLSEKIGELIVDRSALDEFSRQLAHAPRELFVEPAGAMQALIASIVDEEAQE